MKKILIMTVLFVTGFATVQPQDRKIKKHEFQLGAGIWSTTNFTYTLSDVFVNVLPTGMTIKEQSASPVFHLGYKYQMSERLGLGFTLAGGTESANDYVGTVNNGKLNRYYSTFAAEGAFNYLNFNTFKVYGLLGAGALYTSQKYKPKVGKKGGNELFYFDYQISPVGFKFGNNFGAYAELGFGYKGIISAGLFLKM